MSLTAGTRLGLLLGLGLLSAGSAARAPTASETVPVELVPALFGGGRVSGTQYFVGVTPPGWPTALVPSASARALGGTRSRRRVVAVFVDSASREPLAA